MQLGDILKAMQVSQKIRKIALLSVIIVALIGSGGYFATRWNQTTSENTSSFRMAPEFALPDAAGKTHRLSDYRGKIVLLHFWASWCPPCLGEIPQWLELAEDFKGKPIQLLAVSLDQNWEAAHKILPSDKLPPGIVSVIDPKTQTSEQFGSYAFPETYLISPKGQVITKWIGPQDWKSPDFVKMMNTLSEKVGQ